MSEIVYIGLGSNLGDAKAHVLSALDALKRMPNGAFLVCSSLYQTEPVGPSGQADYINAVCAIETTLKPEILLDCLQEIEQEHHRIRRERWGPRTLDLDILLFGERQIQSDRLVVPHPRLAERVFVLRPLFEIRPSLTIPGVGKVNQLLTHCPPFGIRLLSG